MGLERHDLARRQPDEAREESGRDRGEARAQPPPEPDHAAAEDEPQCDGDGQADRIVYQHDFADNDYDASDHNGHGSNVASIAASSDGV